MNDVAGRRRLVKESLCSARGRMRPSIRLFTGPARPSLRVSALRGPHPRSDWRHWPRLYNRVRSQLTTTTDGRLEGSLLLFDTHTAGTRPMRRTFHGRRPRQNLASLPRRFWRPRRHVTPSNPRAICPSRSASVFEIGGKLAACQGLRPQPQPAGTCPRAKVASRAI